MGVPLESLFNKVTGLILYSKETQLRTFFFYRTTPVAAFVIDLVRRKIKLGKASFRC